MMQNRLLPEETALFVIDIQEKLFPKIAHHEKVLHNVTIAIEAAILLQLPIIATEQYPEGLGSTISPIRKLLPKDSSPTAKTIFSACNAKTSLYSNVQNYLLVGIETHVCVLQTAKTLLQLGKNPVVLIDATGSRSSENYAIAKDELRDMGARVTSTETALFELLHDAKNPQFKAFSKLIK